MKLLLGLVVFLILLGVLAAKFLPWWGIVGLLVGLVVGGTVILPRLLRRLFEAPFRAKGAALRGATIEVHSITPAEPRTPGPDDGPLDPEMAARRWLHVELTVTPAKTDGPFQFWEPGEFLFSLPSSSISDPDDVCELSDYQLVRDGGFVSDEEYKHQGPQRLRLHLAVRPDVRDLALRYYFEDLATLKLPASV